MRISDWSSDVCSSDLHRHDLRVTATGGAPLHAEAGAEARLAQADHRLASDPIEAVAEADGRRRLAFAGGGRRHRRDEAEAAVGTSGQIREGLRRHLRLGAAERPEEHPSELESLMRTS